jgi:hypothetical protein
MSTSIEAQMESLSLAEEQPQVEVTAAVDDDNKSSSKSKHVEALESEDTFKTELCKSYLSGRKCRYGRQCRFAHGMQDLRPRDISTANYKSQVCQNWEKTGSCPFGVRCRFLHDEQRVYLTPEIYYLLSWSEHYVRLIIPAELSPFREHRRFRRSARRESRDSSVGSESTVSSADSSPAPESVRSLSTQDSLGTEDSKVKTSKKKVHVLVASAPLDFFSGIMMHCAPFFPFAYPVYDCSMMIPAPQGAPVPYMYYPAHVPTM